MKAALCLALALAACAPIHRIAHPRERTPDWALGADFSLVCATGATTAATYNSGSALFIPALASYLALIALDTWAAR